MISPDTPSPLPNSPPPGMFRITVRIDFDDGTTVTESTDFTKALINPRSDLFDVAVPAAHAGCSLQRVIGQALMDVGGLAMRGSKP